MSEKPEIILASASPRRRELLATLGLPFTVMPADIHEAPWPNEKPASYALRNAHEKALHASEVLGNGSEDRVIVAADTIVVLNGAILEKPVDAVDACRMLRSLSGQTHEVITGLCVRRAHRELGDSVRTKVEFRELSEVEIEKYVASGEPMDKAGAYAIQGGAAGFVLALHGSHSNVVGLPLDELNQLLAGVL